MNEYIIDMMSNPKEYFLRPYCDKCGFRYPCECREWKIEKKKDEKYVYKKI